MKQTLLTNVIMGTMIVLNIGLLAFVFIHNKPPREGPDSRGNRGLPVPELIARALSFSPEQKEAYKKLGRDHHEGLQDIERELGKSMREYFSISIQEATKQEADSQLTSILELEKEKILYTSQHFEDIKHMCTEEQIENFPEVLDILFKRGRGRRKGNRPGGPPLRRE